jgi:hypothetical protein
MGLGFRRAHDAKINVTSVVDQTGVDEWVDDSMKTDGCSHEKWVVA